MLYDCKTNNQSQKRYTMDSLKEKDKLAPKPSKRPRIEVGEELMRQMIARGFLWIRKSSAGFPSRKKAQKKRFRSLCQNPRSTNRFRRSSLPLWLRGKMHPDFVVKSSRYRILNARSSHQRIAVTAQQSTSAPQPRAKCRQSSTCWETTRLGLRRWSTICYALS